MYAWGQDLTGCIFKSRVSWDLISDLINSKIGADVQFCIEMAGAQDHLKVMMISQEKPTDEINQWNAFVCRCLFLNANEECLFHALRTTVIDSMMIY